MRITLSRFMQAFNSVHLENRLSAMKHKPTIQSQRYYKNFGHGRQPDPTSIMLMFGAGIAVAAIGSLKWFQ